MAKVGMIENRESIRYTGILSHLGALLRDWAVRQAGADCYSSASLCSYDSKTRYNKERESWNPT